MSGELAKNMRLIAHDPLNGQGNCGEGISMQLAGDGRRIIWIAHESAPLNLPASMSAIPACRKWCVRPSCPTTGCGRTPLRFCGDHHGRRLSGGRARRTTGGIELFDISDPEAPKTISFLDRSGPCSRGVHQLWFVDGEFIHCASGAADFEPKNQLDDQPYMVVDVRDPSKRKRRAAGGSRAPPSAIARRLRRAIRASIPVFERTIQRLSRPAPIGPIWASWTAAR